MYFVTVMQKQPARQATLTKELLVSGTALKAFLPSHLILTQSQPEATHLSHFTNGEIEIMLTAHVTAYSWENWGTVILMNLTEPVTGRIGDPSRHILRIYRALERWLSGYKRLVALPEYPGSISSTHTVAYNFL